MKNTSFKNSLVVTFLSLMFTVNTLNAQATLTIDPTKTYQTIVGFGHDELNTYFFNPAPSESY